MIKNHRRVLLISGIIAGVGLFIFMTAFFLGGLDTIKFWFN